VIGDGEAETGPLAAAWHSNKFLNPAADGAVLPILHLNGYKIANPTVLARIPHAELESLLTGYGYSRTSSRATSPRHAPADGRHAGYGDRRDRARSSARRARTV
jgi:xylulose-5-phosphate/fructose-6-phosphate phosphoketolase